MRPRNKAAPRALENVLVERNPSDLNVGYLTVLTIIAERNCFSIARKYLQAPSSIPTAMLPSGILTGVSFCLITIRVSEATSPAADGMGKPRNSLPPPLPACAARQLNRAKRKAPQSKLIEAMNQPISG